jgi:hypothetical protein
VGPVSTKTGSKAPGSAAPAGIGVISAATQKKLV